LAPSTEDKNEKFNRLPINQNFTKPTNHIQGLSTTTFIFKDFQGLEFAPFKFKDFPRPGETLGYLKY